MLCAETYASIFLILVPNFGEGGSEVEKIRFFASEKVDFSTHRQTKMGTNIKKMLAYVSAQSISEDPQQKTLALSSKL